MLYIKRPAYTTSLALVNTLARRDIYRPAKFLKYGLVHGGRDDYGAIEAIAQEPTVYKFVARA